MQQQLITGNYKNLVFGRMADTMPHAQLPELKTFPYKGKTLFALPATPDHVNILRNSGYAAKTFAFVKDHPGAFPPFGHQRESIDFLVTNRRAFDLSDMGCVDADTEYLSPTGWVRIADYDGGEVAQYDPDTGAASFVDPWRFIKLPCDEFIHFKHSRGLDQMLCPHHKMMVGYAHTQRRSEAVSAKDFEARSWADKARARYNTAFCLVTGTKLDLTDEQIRLMVAVKADGYMKQPHTKWTVVRLKKQKKVKRLRTLLTKANVSFEETQPEYAGAEGFHVFKFYSPEGTKSYNTWYKANRDQLNVVIDEARFWDASGDKAQAYRFSTRDASSADFIQFAACSTGRTATVYEQPRNGGVDYGVRVEADHRRVGFVGVKDGEKVHNQTRVSTPGQHKYCFEVPTGALVLRRRGNVFITGNCGKTAAAIWAAEYLLQLGMIKNVLVLGTKSTIDTVWAQEIFKLTPHRSQTVVTGSAERKRKKLNEKPVWTVGNHDMIKTKTFNEFIADGNGFDLIIGDEASVFRNAQSQLHKALYALSRPLDRSDPRLWLLTGTPTPQGPEDAFGLARLINERNVPASFNLWRDSVMLNVAKYRWIPKVGAWDKVFAALQPAVRHRFEDCVDIPETTYINKFAPMTKEQQDLVFEVRNHMAAALENGDQIQAANAGVQLLKILQIMQGVVKVDDDKVLDVDNSPRIDVLLETIAEANKKFIVLAPFTAVLHKVDAAIQKAGYKTVFVDGSVTDQKRADRFKEVKEGSADGLVAQCATVAHGLTLTEADTTIWFGPTFSTEHFIQGNRRTNRPGQKDKTRIVTIHSSPLEDRVYQAIQGNAMNQTALLDMFKEVAQGQLL